MARSAVSHAGNGAKSHDFSKHSFESLLELKQALEAELKSRKHHELEELRAKVAQSAHALGVSLHEVLGVRAKRQTKHPRGPQPAKYRGPNGELWSGKGPAPKWM